VTLVEALGCDIPRAVTSFRWALAAIAGLTAVCGAGASRAQAEDAGIISGTAFARSGTWVMWAEQGLVLGTGSRAYAGRVSVNGESAYVALLRVSLDRFVTDRFTAGLVAAASVGHGKFGSAASDTIWGGSAGLRLGLTLPIGQRSVFWPRVTGTLGRGDGQTTAGFDVSAPFVRQISPRFLLAFGPIYQERFESDSGAHRRGLGLQLSFGGAFPVDGGGEPVAAQPGERFGQSGQWVLGVGQALVIPSGTEAGWWQTSGPEGNAGNLVFAVTMDRFVFDHVSLGFTLGLATGARVQNGETSTGTVLVAGAQAAAAIPMGARVVLWPKLSILSHAGDETTRTSYQAFLPLAAELGHLLLGFGPTLESSELSISGGRSLASETGVGLALLIAGWWR
jgi:hypothetical protein